MNKTFLIFLFLVLGSSKYCFSNPSFSKPHGLYEESITVEITPSVAGAQIRYTTDGSVPTASSAIYSEPLAISRTTILRAVEIVGGQTSKACTASYIFIESVLSQPNDPEGYPSNWGKFVFTEGYAPADYEMDPTITNDPESRIRIIRLENTGVRRSALPLR